jgi:hypothetical protein
MEEALKLLGLGTPFIYAGATYAFFHWLDSNASDSAKMAISNWIKSSEYNKEHVAEAITDIFDRVCSSPLFTWRAFIRSVLISLIVLAIFTFEFIRWTTDEFTPTYIIHPNSIHWAVVATNVISDYISLFVIRRALQYAGHKPVLALLFGAGCGVLLTALLMWGRDAAILLLNMKIAPSIVFGKPIVAFQAYSSLMDFLNLVFSMPALAVHLWLVVVAIGLVGMKALTYMAKATDAMQWFIKQGRDHPLDAVGMVAAAMVFVTASTASVLHFVF